MTEAVNTKISCLYDPCSKCIAKLADCGWNTAGNTGSCNVITTLTELHFYLSWFGSIQVDIFIGIHTYLSLCLSAYPYVNHLSLFLPAYPSVCTFAHMSFYLLACMPVHLCNCLSICLSTYLSVLISLCLSIYLPIYPPIYFTVYQPVSQSAYPFTHLSVCPSICLSIHLTICIEYDGF